MDLMAQVERGKEEETWDPGRREGGWPLRSDRSTGGQLGAAATSSIDFLRVVLGGQEHHCTMNM